MSSASSSSEEPSSLSTESDGTTLASLAGEFGRRLSPRTVEFAGLALAIQRARFRAGHADTESINRSVSLLALISIDEDVRAAGEAAGLTESAWAKKLGVTTRLVPPLPVEDAPVHPDLRDGLRAYLRTAGTWSDLSLVDIALAIFVSARDPAVGLLAIRLNELRVDIELAIEGLEALLARERRSPDAAIEANDGDAYRPPDFSASVRQVRDRLGGSTLVTAAMIAQSLQSSHPGYGGGRFGDVTLKDVPGIPRPTDDWLVAVRDLYDAQAVARSRHEVIDGELTLLGLCELDPPLRSALDDDDFYAALNSSVAVRPRHASDGSIIRWADDAPTTVDLLGRQGVAQALGTRIRDLARGKGADRRSFLVHVDGAWGSGKSSLFELIAEDLVDGFLIVRVNAWREQRIRKPWWTVLTALRQAVRGPMSPPGRLGVWLVDAARRLRSAWVPLLATALVLAALVIWWTRSSTFSLDIGAETADSILKVVSLVSAAVAGLVAAARYFVPSSRRSTIEAVESDDNPMDAVQLLFARELRRAQKPVVFLVDDLDRCDDSYVVEFLEALQTLVRDAPDRLDGKAAEEVAGPFGFIAADGKWIRDAYEHRYPSFVSSDDEQPLGYRFLEKVFQQRFVLPTITQASLDYYLGSLLTRSSSAELSAADKAAVKVATAKIQAATTETEIMSLADAADGIASALAKQEVVAAAAAQIANPAIARATENELRQFGSLLAPNPRSVKHFVNTYGVLRTLRIVERVSVPLEPLALWAIVEIRWPYLADYLRANPEGIGGDADDKRVTRLLRKPEVSRVLKDPRGGPLTPELIRQCSGGG